MAIPVDRAPVKNRHIVCDAPAKINLALHVTGQRIDGYHELESLVVFCELGDRIEIRSLPNAPTDRVKLHSLGPFSGVLPIAPENIVQKAVKKFRAVSMKPDCGLDITIEKNLPVASGIGGGSADAAATLIALAKFGDAPHASNLEGIANDLGSDVPMCLASNPLIARGRGEVIEEIKAFPDLFLVLVNPGVAVSTPQVFTELRTKENPPLAALPDPLTQSALVDWLKTQRNDLETPTKAIAPVITDVLYALDSTKAELARMSGSGATCFGLFKDAAAAESAALQIGKNHPDWWVVATRASHHGKNRAWECNNTP